MENETYFREQADAIFSLLPAPHRRPINRKMEGMLHGEKAMLLFLSEHDGVTAGELSQALEIGSGGVANALNALESKEWIVRQRSFTDRRKVIVSLSQEGRKHIALHRDEMLDTASQILERLGRKDTEELVRILYRLHEIGDTLCVETIKEQKGTEHVENLSVHGKA